MADSYTPRLLAALRSRSFADAADLIETQQDEIARLRKIEEAAQRAVDAARVIDAMAPDGVLAELTGALRDHR